MNNDTIKITCKAKISEIMCCSKEPKHVKPSLITPPNKREVGALPLPKHWAVMYPFSSPGFVEMSF
jgi:hypothetical protein